MCVCLIWPLRLLKWRASVLHNCTSLGRTIRMSTEVGACQKFSRSTSKKKKYFMNAKPTSICKSASIISEPRKEYTLKVEWCLQWIIHDLVNTKWNEDVKRYWIVGFEKWTVEHTETYIHVCIMFYTQLLTICMPKFGCALIDWPLNSSVLLLTDHFLWFRLQFCVYS